MRDGRNLWKGTASSRANRAVKWPALAVVALIKREPGMRGRIRIVLGRFDQPGADWIQMNVPSVPFEIRPIPYSMVGEALLPDSILEAISFMKRCE